MYTRVSDDNKIHGKLLPDDKKDYTKGMMEFENTKAENRQSESWYKPLRGRASQSNDRSSGWEHYGGNQNSFHMAINSIVQCHATQNAKCPKSASFLLCSLLSPLWDSARSGALSTGSRLNF